MNKNNLNCIKLFCLIIVIYFFSYKNSNLYITNIAEVGKIFFIFLIIIFHKLKSIFINSIGKLKFIINTLYFFVKKSIILLLKL